MRDFRPMNDPSYQQDWQVRESERAAREKEIRADFAARNRAMYPLAGMITTLTLTLLLSILNARDLNSGQYLALVLTAALGPIALAKCGFCFIAMSDSSACEDWRGLLPAPHRREMLAASLTLCLLAFLTLLALLPPFNLTALQFLLPGGETPFLPSWALIPLTTAPALLLTTCAVDRLTCRPRPG